MILSISYYESYHESYVIFLQISGDAGRRIYNRLFESEVLVSDKKLENILLEATQKRVREIYVATTLCQTFFRLDLCFFGFFQFSSEL